jgi:hypothetical protein
MGFGALASFTGAFFFYAPFPNPYRWIGFLLTFWIIYNVLRGLVTKEEISK